MPDTIKIISVVLILILTACTHKQAGKIIKTADGKFYYLTESIGHEQYRFNPIDTTDFKLINDVRY